MKKVLIITYYWPPAGGPGVQRVLKFAKYLPEFGWQPIILTVQNGEYPAYDESLFSDIPKECKVFKTPAIEPFSLYKKFTGMKSDEVIPVATLAETKTSWKKKLAHWIRLNLFIPDAKIGWIPFAVKAGKHIIRNEKPDIIFSSSPPPTVHLIAKKLAKWSGIKWVADFRDPWTEIHYYKTVKRSSCSRKIDKEKEKKVLNNTNAIVTISEQMKISFSNRANTDCNVITNGYDPMDFTEILKKENSNFLKILYVGNAGNQRDPYVVFKSLYKLARENKIDIKKIKMIFAGKITENIRNYKLQFPDINIEFLDYISYKSTLQLIINSDILLLLINNIPNNEGIITSKIFNYIASGNFILGLGPEDGEAAKIIDVIQTGIMVDYCNEEKLNNIIKTKYDEWQRNGNITLNQKSSEKYSKYNQTKKMIEIFEALNENN